MDFEIIEGSTYNGFHRGDATAVHVLAGIHPRPRLLAAFPGGNVGAGLWFERNTGAQMAVPDGLQPVQQGRLHGVRVTVECSTASLAVEGIALGNIRMLRGVDHGEAVPEQFAATIAIEEGALVARRTALDGSEEYRLRLEVLGGTVARAGGRYVAASEGPLRLRFEALTSAAVMAPLEGDELLNERAGSDQRARQVLSFLSYRDKLCAGSWRFLSYFGRDTLLTVRLMMPVLADVAVEAGLASVLERLSPEGRVAHEEALGEWSADTFGESPSFDWTMIDDDYMLSAVAMTYFESERGRARASAFLTRESTRGGSYGERLARNLRWVWTTAQPFAASGAAADLIRIEAGGRVGQWRDSQTGLAGGTYPWDVNVVLLPAALRALATLGPQVLGEEMPADEDLARVRDAWTKSAALFEMEVDRDRADAAIGAYAARYGMDPTRARAALPETLRFPALALRDDGSQVPVMHSDLGYWLIFDRPEAEVLEGLADLVLRPFPAGLHTPVGIPVANPVLATADEELGLTPGHYHGACMWPWQHAMWILGLREQAERADLSAGLRQRLRQTADEVHRVSTIEELRTAELWTWRSAGDSMQAIPFGPSDDHFAESNAAQLWSTINLALHTR